MRPMWWQYPDKTECEEFLWIAAFTLFVTFFSASIGSRNIVRALVIYFAPGTIFAFLTKSFLWQRKQIRDLIGVLRYVSTQECDCTSSTCRACRAREVLKEHFPNEIPFELLYPNTLE